MLSTGMLKAEDNDALFRMPDHTTQSIEELNNGTMCVFSWKLFLYIGFKETPVGSSQISHVCASQKRGVVSSASCVTFLLSHPQRKPTFAKYLLVDRQWTFRSSVVSDCRTRSSLAWCTFPNCVQDCFLARVVFEVSVGSPRLWPSLQCDDVLLRFSTEAEECATWENVRAPFDPNAKTYLGEDYFESIKDHTLGTPQCCLDIPRYSTQGTKTVLRIIRGFAGASFHRNCLKDV
ncbi:MAM and LDL-receptor class A domain-containing protein 2, partial [Caerostris extrusa]